MSSDPTHTATPRYAPSIPFPDEAFVPGHGARPTFDFAFQDGLPNGSESPLEPVSAQNWHCNPRFLYACDLFNHHYYWEAHEAWEELWHEVSDPRIRDALQTMILIAAAHLKDRIGEARIAVILRGRARSRWERMGPSGPTLGVEPSWFNLHCVEITSPIATRRSILLQAR